MGTKPNEIDATPGKKKKVDSEEFEESEESKARRGVKRRWLPRRLPFGTGTTPIKQGHEVII